MVVVIRFFVIFFLKMKYQNFEGYYYNLSGVSDILLQFQGITCKGVTQQTLKSICIGTLRRVQIKLGFKVQFSPVLKYRCIYDIVK